MHFGFSKYMLTDNASYFTSHLWNEMARVFGIKLLKSAVYKPSNNGEVECRNRDIMNLLRCMTHDHPQKWAQYLYPVQAALNSTVHSAKGLTPFSLLFGRDYTHLH